MSRYVSDLSTYNMHHKDGLQLITITQRIYGGERSTTRLEHPNQRRGGLVLIDDRLISVGVAT
jgi:hypothetical protein